MLRRPPPVNNAPFSAMTTTADPPGVDLRVLGGESAEWAAGFRKGWDDYVNESDPHWTSENVDELAEVSFSRYIVSRPFPQKMEGEKDCADYSLLDYFKNMGKRGDFIDGYKEGWDARDKGERERK